MLEESGVERGTKMLPVSNDSLLAAQIGGSTTGTAKAVSEYQARQREEALAQQVQRGDKPALSGRREAPVDTVEIRFREGQTQSETEVRLETRQQERRAEDEARADARREESRRFDREAPGIAEPSRNIPPGSQINISV